jgi:pyruvate,water dikinase
MQQLVRKGQIPAEIEVGILDTYRAMCRQAGEENLNVSVRSSALHEDIYYKDKGFNIEEMAMAVGVVCMVRARASGIIYSRDPGNGPHR